jgi:hypothetical protein
MLRRSSGYFFFFFYLVLDALFEHGGNVLPNPVMVKMVGFSIFVPSGP